MSDPMTKDYAKNKRNHYKTKNSSTRGRWENSETASFFSPVLWLVIGTILGMVLAFGVYWKFLQNPAHPLIAFNTIRDTAPVASVASGAPVATQTTAESASDQPEKKIDSPRFDFYTVLPNMDVDIAQEDSGTDIPADQATTPLEAVMSAKVESRTAPVEKPQQYIIQLASFKAYTQAEALKATLALKGFQCKIQPIKIKNDEIRYRVYVGPFDDKTLAKTTQAKLESQHKMNSLVLEINV